MSWPNNLTWALLSAKYAGQSVDFGALPCGYMAVDWDTFVMDNSGTKKEAVSRTYQGVDGYTPSATYLGSLGYCLELALRPGVQHSALDTEFDLERTLPMAAKLTALPLLFRADSGLCSLKIMQEITAQAAALSREVAFIIKWNPRRAPVEAIAAQRVQDTQTMWCHLRDGKRITHEQFHSEFKSDMDLERLPSGKFDTNFLVCALAAVAMNILRLIGQSALTGKDAPLRHQAKRRRMKTVMQELMFKAGRMVKHAGRWVLGLGANDSAYAVFERLYEQLAPRRKPGTA